jgi:hypothetical protein
MPFVHLADHRVEVASPGARGFGEQLHVLGEERHDGELPDRLVGALAGPIEEVPPRPAALAGRWGEQEDVDGAGVVDALDAGRYPGGVRAPANELRVVTRAR